MLGSLAECHRSAASTELQHSDPRNGLLWVAAATLQLTALLTSQRVFCQPRCGIRTIARIVFQFRVVAGAPPGSRRYIWFSRGRS